MHSEVEFFLEVFLLGMVFYLVIKFSKNLNFAIKL